MYQHAANAALALCSPLFVPLSCHVNIRNLQSCHQRSDWLVRRGLALLKSARLMLEILGEKLLEVVQFEDTWFANTSCRGKGQAEVADDANLTSGEKKNYGQERRSSSTCLHLLLLACSVHAAFASRLHLCREDRSCA